jgi:hypothetical protein
LGEAAVAADADAASSEPATTYDMALSTGVPCSGIASLPEGALLSITAQSDLSSACALVAAGGVAQAILPVAIGALRAAIDKAKEDHRLAAAAIETERAADRAQHAAQQTAMQHALTALEPLRTGRTQERFADQLQQIFGMLEQGAGGASARDTEFDARSSDAASALLRREVAARARVAEGELHALAVTA